MNNVHIYLHKLETFIKLPILNEDTMRIPYISRDPQEYPGDYVCPECNKEYDWNEVETEQRQIGSVIVWGFECSCGYFDEEE